MVMVPYKFLTLYYLLVACSSLVADCMPSPNHHSKTSQKRLLYLSHSFQPGHFKTWVLDFYRVTARPDYLKKKIKTILF
jgi:hypothetical protein